MIPKTQSTLSSNIITSILDDKDGTLWVGTFDGGLNKLDFEGKKFTRLLSREGDKNSIGGNYIYKLTHDKEGNIWVVRRWFTK